MKASVLGALALAVTLSAQAETAPLAIDAGHSKAKSGAISARGNSEFSFNTVLATVVSDAIAARGTPVLRIGHDGDMVDLKQRTALANAANARFFLAIHHDSVQPHYLKSWQWLGKTQHYSDYAAGFSLFVSRKNPQAQTSLRCAMAIGSALKQQGFAVATHHSENIAGENRAWANQDSGVYYFDDLIVLKTAAMPAVLLEAGVIVNPQQELTLQKPSTQAAIALAIEQGLQACRLL